MAKNIMIQGTMSNAGKSILCAGLCRIFRQDGYRVAPFKSQNMALNSFITAAGGEMGRAQVVQAEAAGIAPDVRMNPILLKPTTDVGSQVIVNGVVQGNMHAMEYYRRKREYIPAVMEAYNSLAAENDILVIEGAGSPAEINLKQEDIVNMGLAKLVDAPVLLVGDIDRGSERRAIDIAVVRLPRISNFTDVSPFERYENVSVRYIERAAELGAPDMIVLPGTKSTIADLKWLRESGLEAAILKAADGGTLVFGICGGYQMLGRSVSDPELVEAAGITDIAGMGLLDMDTVFRGEKVQTQTRGTFSGVAGELACLNGLSYEGYEIHMGRSREARGVVTGGGNVYGSYIHGIFDAPGVADAVLGALCRKKGLSPSILGAFDPVAYREEQYDKLAQVVREGLDMELVYRILDRRD